MWVHVFCTLIVCALIYWLVFLSLFVLPIFYYYCYSHFDTFIVRLQYLVSSIFMGNIKDAFVCIVMYLSKIYYLSLH